MELREYIKAHEPSNSLSKASSVCEDEVEVRRRAKVLVRTINIWAEEHDMLDGLVGVSTSAVWYYIRDPLPGEERVESYFFRTELRG